MTTLTLTDLGWSPFFQSQLDPDSSTSYTPVRVMAVHRGALDVASPTFDGRVAAPHDSDDDSQVPTVGDWLLIDSETHVFGSVLDRKSLFKRRAAGIASKIQLIAANVDTVFIVSSCNQDFNPARLERYLVLARDADVMPVIVLTKADLCDDPSSYVHQAMALQPGLLVEALDARTTTHMDVLLPWCGTGQTVALMGSSGVGKSTLVNTLTGVSDQATQSIRDDDAKGRHTTTGRSLHRLPAGGWLLDTPGMRELQLTDVEDGLADVFADIHELATACRFSDCGHDTEPGCAVQDAIAKGTMDEARLQRFRKLESEETRNSQSIAERRAKDKSFGKLIKGVKSEMKRRGKQ